MFWTIVLALIFVFYVFPLLVSLFVLFIPFFKALARPLFQLLILGAIFLGAIFLIILFFSNLDILAGFIVSFEYIFSIVGGIIILYLLYLGSKHLYKIAKDGTLVKDIKAQPIKSILFVISILYFLFSFFAIFYIY